MPRKYLCDCAPGDIVEDVFVISGKQFSPTTTGKHYIKAFVSDRTCQVTARMWNATKEYFAAMPEAGFLLIRGRIENYQNNLQCIIEQFWLPEAGSYEVGELLPKTTRDAFQMWHRLVEILGTIRNRHLTALVKAYLEDQELMAQFRRAPAAQTFHHAFVGGLLEHTLNAIEVADAIAPFYPGLNRDLVVAGIFLHDIAKTWELRYECAFGYTDGGQLVGHIVKSAIWVEHKAKEAEATLGEPIPQPLVDVIQHIIISHHGLPEFGAIKPPGTPEAIAVHVIENLDAKLMMSLGATRGEAAAGAEGNWTEYMKAFSGRLYRPDVAPPDSPAIEPDAAPAPQFPEQPYLSQSAPPAVPVTAVAAPVTAAAAPPDRMMITNPLFQSDPVKRR